MKKLLLLILLFICCIHIATATTYILNETNVTKDTFTSNSVPDTNYGTENTLISLDYTPYENNIYIEFNTSLLPSIYTTGLDSAVLSLTIINNELNAGESFLLRPYDLINSTWNETTATYNNPPNSTINRLSETFTTRITNLATVNSTVNINVTLQLEHCMNYSAETCTIELKPLCSNFPAFTCDSHIIEFASKELTIFDTPFLTYVTDETAPVITVTSINNDTTSPYVTFNSTNINLSFTTDELATCKWSTNTTNDLLVDKSYIQMMNDENTTNTTSHWIMFTADTTTLDDFSNPPNITKLARDTIHIACIDNFGNYNIGSNNLDVNYFINATRPEVSVSISPSPATETNNLTFINTTTDIDGDSSFTYSIIWFQNSTQIPLLNNQTIVNSTYTNVGDNWIVQLTVDDGFYSTTVNSSILTIADLTKPELFGDRLTSSSGQNDAPFTIYVNVTEENSISTVIVEVTTPTPTSANFTMNLFTGIETNGTYNKTYTPSTDGIYTFKFFARDGSGNIQTLNSTLTYTESTAAGTTGGGGGSSSTQKRKCNIVLNEKEIIMIGTKTFLIQIMNNDTVSYSPSVQLSSELQGILQYTLPSTTIPAGTMGELNIINLNTASNATGKITLVSSICTDIIIPVKIIPSVIAGEFFNRSLFKIGDIDITNLILFAISAVFATFVIVIIKDVGLGIKFLIFSLIVTGIMTLFNLFF